jgi:D-sedoheptulose 7-phosphate isomerase
VMGNGGSACDAQHVAVEFIHPIIEKRRALPAFDLVSQIPVLTAISNDKDFAKVFVDQLELWGKPGDMALAISTSGQSPNLIYALESARKKGMLTIAFSGKDGGRLTAAADYCFTVPSFSIHRIQESHVALLHILWDLTHVALGEEDVI